MNIQELVAKQQLEIENLKEKLQRALEDKESIVMELVCIGGPLNDNKLKYTQEQLKILFRIHELANRQD